MNENFSSEIVLICQEVRIVSKGRHIYIFSFLNSTLLIKIMVIFCNLVSILARRWHFNRSWPVCVHKTETECQVFNLLLWDISIRFIQWNKEMCGSYTTLCCLLRDQEKIITFVRVVVLNKYWVYYCSWFWIQHFISFLNKYSLVNSFVNYNQSNLWDVCRVKMTFQSFFKLRNFILNDLVSHSFSNTVSVNNYLIRIAFFNVFELCKCFDQASIQIFFDNFLVFCLNYHIWIERSTMLVCRSRKSNYWIFALMTYINSNNHYSIFIHKFRKLNSDWLSSNFWIDLLHNIWSNRHIKFSHCSF